MSYTKNLISLKAFLPNNKYIIDIVKYCGLKDTNDWKIWIDDYGNILSVDYKRHTKIKLNQNIDLQTINSKDLYFKANIKDLARINKCAVISTSENSYYIWMLDENNILRLCYYLNDILMENQPVLISGLKNLKIIMDNLDVDGFKILDSITEPLGTNIMKSWATSWPLSKDLISLLPNQIIKDCSLA